MVIFDYNKLPKELEKYDAEIALASFTICFCFVAFFYLECTRLTAEIAVMHSKLMSFDSFNRMLLDIDQYSPNSNPFCYLNCTYANGTGLDMTQKFETLFEFNKWKRTVHINISKINDNFNESEQWFEVLK